VGVGRGMRRKRGRTGEVKKGERDKEYEKWVPREQNRRGRETTRVREKRGLEYPVLDIMRGNRTRPILVGGQKDLIMFLYTSCSAHWKQLLRQGLLLTQGLFCV
jgi:hypothetical protein